MRLRSRAAAFSLAEDRSRDCNHFRSPAFDCEYHLAPGSIRRWKGEAMKNRTIPPRANRGLDIGMGALLPFRADFPTSRVRDRPKYREPTREALLDLLARDIKSPLAIIEEYVDLLVEDADRLRPDDRRDVLNRIGAAARQAMMPALNLLDAARIEDGPLDPRREPVDLADLLRQVFSRQERVAEVNGILLVQEIEADLPALDADGALLDRVFANLVYEVIRFAPRGSQVRARAARKADEIEIVVEDVGTRTPEQMISTLVHRYLDDSGRPPTADLSQFVAKAILESHGGTLTVEKPPNGGGCRFRVALPVRR
jgi:two-component system, OmpR family, sensor histidine kinase KdpD